MAIYRLLSSPKLPRAMRRKVKEYINEKIAGRYGMKYNGFAINFDQTSEP